MRCIQLCGTYQPIGVICAKTFSSQCPCIFGGKVAKSCFISPSIRRWLLIATIMIWQHLNFHFTHVKSNGCVVDHHIARFRVVHKVCGNIPSPFTFLLCFSLSIICKLAISFLFTLFSMLHTYCCVLIFCHNSSLFWIVWLNFVFHFTFNSSICRVSIRFIVQCYYITPMFYLSYCEFCGIIMVNQPNNTMLGKTSRRIIKVRKIVASRKTRSK